MNRNEEHHYASILLAVLLFCAASCAVLAVATKAFGQTIYMPQVSQRCNPCAHSVPMPTATPTPTIGEPPMPTVEVQP